MTGGHPEVSSSGYDTGELVGWSRLAIGRRQTVETRSRMGGQMLKKVLCTLVVAMLCGFGFSSEESQGWSMNATIIEACSCSMFCPCFFKSKPTGKDETGHFCKFNMAVHVNSGHDGETSLEGVKYWVAGNLAAKQAVITFDDDVTPEQRAGIQKALGKLYSPIEWKSLTVGDDGNIEWRASGDKAVATIDGGERAEVVLVANPGMDGEPVVLKNLAYWAADDHEGFVMMPNEVEAWRQGDNAFEFRGTTGFMITVSVASDPSQGS